MSKSYSNSFLSPLDPDPMIHHVFERIVMERFVNDLEIYESLLNE